jgi:carboxypeptidase C (cathepsin A)
MATSHTRRFLYGISSLALIALLAATPLLAQKPESGETNAKPKDGDLPERILPADMTITKTAVATIRGERVPYRVTTGTQPVYGEDGKTIAALYYTYYERTDVSDTASRPLFISFNGGPGSGSLWMHLGYTSPKQLVIDDEGYPVTPASHAFSTMRSIARPFLASRRTSSTSPTGSTSSFRARSAGAPRST